MTPALKVCQRNDLENQIHKLSWQEDRQQNHPFRNSLVNGLQFSFIFLKFLPA